MQANYGESEIKALLQKVRIFNRELGSYQLFAITDNFDYAVKLSNGKILLKIEDLQEDERENLTQDALIKIANRFVPSIPQPDSPSKFIQETQPTNNSIQKKKGSSRF